MTASIRPTAAAKRRLLRIRVDGLQIDAECRESGVIDLVVRADQQHEGLWSRMRQNLANALFRAGRRCDPCNHNGPLRVVELHVPPASIQDQETWFRECQAIHRWPTNLPNGETHYQTFVVHEGVESHQERWLALDQFFSRLGRQERADDAHAPSPDQSRHSHGEAGGVQ